MTKINTLKDYIENALGEKTIEITESDYQENLFEVETEKENFEFLVLTDEEADERAEEEIKELLWAFNTDFIINHTTINADWAYNQTKQAIQEMQRKLCENANEIIKCMIDDIDEFIQDSIDEDGRGHFLSGYDGEEVEVDDYFVYRVN